VAVTSLCEIKFNRKDVKAMNTLMCRRLVSALYQVKVDSDAEFDKQGRGRQGLPDFVPDQFMVLYGIKTLAIKNINEFLYGVRAERYRLTAKGDKEAEPLLFTFWRATHHGVPFEDRMPSTDFDFYIDLLGMVAKTVGKEHTLTQHCASVGAFWNLLGSMTEIHLPVFVLINSLSAAYEKSHHDLFDRLKRMVTSKAAVLAKEAKERAKDRKNPGPEEVPRYKRTVLGTEKMDARGHVGLDMFMALCVEGAEKQREKDAKILENVFKSWSANAAGSSFDAFCECLADASPELPTDEVIALFQMATANQDSPDFTLIEGSLRKRNIILKSKAGLENVQAMKIDDLKTLSKCSTLFGVSSSSSKKANPFAKASGGGAEGAAGGAEGAVGGAEGAAGGDGRQERKSKESMGRWGVAKAGTRANSLIRMLLMQQTEEGDIPGDEG